MTVHAEKRVIRHQPEQLFDLVAGVQHCQNFSLVSGGACS